MQDPIEAHPNLDAPLLLYIDGAKGKRPRWFRWLWRLSNASRLLIRRLPPRPKQLVTDLIALTVYWPLSRLASLAEAATAATTPSALPRRSLRHAAGLVDLRFSPRAPYWCVVGVRQKA